jgi:hypothetical protein
VAWEHVGPRTNRHSTYHTVCLNIYTHDLFNCSENTHTHTHTHTRTHYNVTHWQWIPFYFVIDCHHHHKKTPQCR